MSTQNQAPATLAFELVVFDWDGTLMDSAARIVACLQAAFAEVGRPPPGAREASDIIGLGLDEALTRLWPSSTEAQRVELVGHYRRHFLVLNETPATLFPGASEMLSRLADQGHLLAVGTGKSRAGLDKELEETGLRGHFLATRCADETFSKPHPQMLLELMDELGVRARDTLMVGDTEYDLHMARNAGTAALAVCHGVHDRERLLACAPLDCLKSLAEIPPWLAGLNGSIRS